MTYTDKDDSRVSGGSGKIAGVSQTPAISQFAQTATGAAIAAFNDKRRQMYGDKWASLDWFGLPLGNKEDSLDSVKADHGVQIRRVK